MSPPRRCTHLLIIVTILLIFSLSSYCISPPKRPLLLVPGYTGSILYARNTTDNSTFKIFPVQNQTFEYLNCKCITEQEGDSKRCDSPFPDLEIFAPTDRFGLESIDILDTDKQYYHNLIELLTKEGGYEEGVTLFGFPYDWRQSFSEISNQLHETVTNILNTTKSDKIDILSHSMGCVLVKKYLSDTSDDSNDDTHSFVDKYISVAGPYGGIGASWVIISLYGTMSEQLPNATPWELHQLSMQFPSTYDFIASSTYYADQISQDPDLNELKSPNIVFFEGEKQVIMISNNSMIDIVIDANKNNNITLPNNPDTPCPLPFRDDYYEKAKISWEQTFTKMQSINFYEVYGIGKYTTYSWFINVNLNMSAADPYSKLLSNGKSFPLSNYTPFPFGCLEGDGLITHQSTKYSGFTPVFSAYLPLSHVDLIHNDTAFPIYLQFLSDSCSWQGYWDINFESIDESKLEQLPSILQCPDLPVMDGDQLCDGELCGTYNGNFTAGLLKVYKSNWIAFTDLNDLSSSYTTIESMVGRVWSNTWSGRMQLQNGELLSYSITLNQEDNCNSFRGWYANDWSPESQKQITGTRSASIPPNQCTNGEERSCILENGAGKERCSDGFWVPCSSCVEGYTYNNGFPYNFPRCDATGSNPPPPSPSSPPSPSTSSVSSTPTPSNSTEVYETTGDSTNNWFSEYITVINTSASSEYEAVIPWWSLLIAIVVSFLSGMFVVIIIIAIFLILRRYLLPFIPLFKSGEVANEINDGISYEQ